MNTTTSRRPSRRRTGSVAALVACVALITGLWVGRRTGRTGVATTMLMRPPGRRQPTRLRTRQP